MEMEVKIKINNFLLFLISAWLLGWAIKFFIKLMLVISQFFQDEYGLVGILVLDPLFFGATAILGFIIGLAIVLTMGD